MCCVVELLRCSLFYLCVVVRVICVALCLLLFTWRCVRYLCGLEGWALIVIALCMWCCVHYLCGPVCMNYVILHVLFVRP